MICMSSFLLTHAPGIRYEPVCGPLVLMTYDAEISLVYLLLCSRFLNIGYKPLDWHRLD